MGFTSRGTSQGKLEQTQQSQHSAHVRFVLAIMLEIARLCSTLSQILSSPHTACSITCGMNTLCIISRMNLRSRPVGAACYLNLDSELVLPASSTLRSR